MAKKHVNKFDPPHAQLAGQRRVTRAATPHERIDRLERLIAELSGTLNRQIEKLRTRISEGSSEAQRVFKLEGAMVTAQSMIDTDRAAIKGLRSDFELVTKDLEERAGRMYAALSEQHQRLNSLSPAAANDLFSYVKAIEERYDKKLESLSKQINCLFARSRQDKPGERCATLREIDALIETYASDRVTETGKAIYRTALELKTRRLRDEEGS